MAWLTDNLKPQDIWLMVFVFDSNRPSDAAQAIQPKPFRFIKVVGANLTKNDWSFSGRSELSRRTITATVTKSGYQKQICQFFQNYIQASHSIIVDIAFQEVVKLNPLILTAVKRWILNQQPYQFVEQ